MSSASNNAALALQELATKRELNSEDVALVNKKQKLLSAGSHVYQKPSAQSASLTGKEKRLEQNRRAARSSRNRKKVMVEELQRSVLFFSRANGSLRQQNDDLTRQIMEAQIKVAAIEGKAPAMPVIQPAKPIAVAAVARVEVPKPPPVKQAPAEPVVQEEKQKKQPPSAPSIQQQQEAANAVAAQAMYAMNGLPFATTTAAPVVAANADGTIPDMKLGSTMQAMSEFQQATSVAMHMAMAQMQNSVPAMTAAAVAAMPGTVAQAQQDYMTALAMQQAAAMRYFQPLIMAQQQQQQQKQGQQSQAPNKETNV